MKKNSLVILFFILATLGLIIGLISWGNKNQADKPSATSLNNLIGKKAPNFILTDRDDKTYTNESLLGKNVVLFFNEGLICYPACWNQIAALGKDERFNNSDTATISVVADSKKSWQPAFEKMPSLTKGTVAFDADKAVSARFGMLNVASSMHSGSLPGHTYVIIDKLGIVRYAMDDPRMGINNDKLAEEILKIDTIK